MDYEFDKCPICEEYDWLSRHTCKPFYFVWREHEDFETDVLDYNSHKISARDEEEAATKFADSDWEFPNYETVFVIPYKKAQELIEVNDDSEMTKESQDKILKEAKKFELESEIVRNFYAHEITNNS